MFIEDRAVVPEAARPQWDYTSFVHVGPLRFGMTHDEAVAAMPDFLAGQPRPRPSRAGVAYSCTEFRAGSASASASTQQHAVIAYFSEVDGLYSVAINALCGPQVTLDGIRLVGRPPSELNAEIEAYTQRHGIGLMIAPTGDYGAREFGYIPGVQRAGDLMLTCPAFGIVHSGANTLYDSIPEDPWAWR